jgi:hypothetical protein
MFQAESLPRHRTILFHTERDPSPRFEDGLMSLWGPFSGHFTPGKYRKIPKKRARKSSRTDFFGIFRIRGAPQTPVGPPRPPDPGAQDPRFRPPEIGARVYYMSRKLHNANTEVLVISVRFCHSTCKTGATHRNPDFGRFGPPRGPPGPPPGPPPGTPPGGGPGDPLGG